MTEPTHTTERQPMNPPYPLTFADKTGRYVVTRTGDRTFTLETPTTPAGGTTLETPTTTDANALWLWWCTR